MFVFSEFTKDEVDDFLLLFMLFPFLSVIIFCDMTCHIHLEKTVFFSRFVNIMFLLKFGS